MKILGMGRSGIMMPNKIQSWNDADGAPYIAAFNRWNDKRNVNVNRNDNRWNDNWSFAGRRNSLHFSPR